METFFFMIVAAVAVLASILVITCKNPINSALSLILTFFCLATLYVTLDAPFMAAIQVLVYAGAIMVLIVFVIMLLNVRTESGRRTSHSVLFGSLIGLFTLCQLFYLFNRGSLNGSKGVIDSELVNRVGHTELIANALYTDFLLPFEITSILLLVAIIGAVILTKKKI
jgi:NADH-quinone oxidoreductase subunit J